MIDAWRKLRLQSVTAGNRGRGGAEEGWGQWVGVLGETSTGAGTDRCRG